MSRSAVTASGYNQLVCDTPTTTDVAASTTPVTLLAVNYSRVQASIFNDSTSTLYVLWSSGDTVSATHYTVKIAPNGYYEIPRGNQYVGLITGVWTTATGTAHMTEAV